MNGGGLIIVGNGFDVNHGYPSSYLNFKKWLNKNNKLLYNSLEEYIDVSGEWWNEFERNLSEFDVPKLIKDTPIGNSPRDFRLPVSYSYPASGRLNSMVKELSRSFTKWVKSLDGIPVKKIIDLPESKLYVSFNYTNTLERIYGINENRILYIHGKASRGDKLIFGHGRNHFLLEEDVMKKYGLYKSEDFFIPGTYGDDEYQLVLRISFLEKRPYDQLIKYREVILPAIMESSVVFVYGLSFSEVDFPYIEWIVEKNSNLRWRVSWHVEDDKKRIKNTFDALNVREYEMFYL